MVKHGKAGNGSVDYCSVRYGMVVLCGVCRGLVWYGISKLA